MVSGSTKVKETESRQSLLCKEDKRTKSDQEIKEIMGEVYNEED